MSDPFKTHARGLESPATRQALIAPDDAADLPVRPRVLYCQAEGTARLRDEAGVEITYTLSAGQILPLSPLRVLATGTSATLIGWW